MRKLDKINSVIMLVACAPHPWSVSQVQPLAVAGGENQQLRVSEYQRTTREDWCWKEADRGTVIVPGRPVNDGRSHHTGRQARLRVVTEEPDQRGAERRDGAGNEG